MALLTGLRCRPNDDFIRQLKIFYKASFKVSKHDKETRLLYLERAVREVMSECHICVAV